MRTSASRSHGSTRAPSFRGRTRSAASCTRSRRGECEKFSSRPFRGGSRPRGQLARCNLRRVSLRICFVTPFAWSQPHEVNAHVEGTAAALRRLGHEVTILAPSSRARDLLAGRRALQRGTDTDVIAVCPSIPLSRRTNMGMPVAVRANLRLALSRGRYDVVHGFEPGLPSLSYLALTSTHALTAATFFSPDRLGYPTRRSRRDRLRARVD